MLVGGSLVTLVVAVGFLHLNLEGGGDHKWWFRSKMNASSVLGAIIGGGDTQTLLAVKKFKI